MAEYVSPLRGLRTRTAARAATIPLWEKGFATVGLFLCLDAGVRTLRILGGTEGPIQSITSAEVDYSQGSTLTQILLFAVYLVSLMLLAMYPTRQLMRALKAKLIWLLPALAMISVLWSGAPLISFRRAVALLGSAIFGLYLATRFPRLELLRVLLAVSVIATVLSLLVVVALPAYAIDDSGAWQGVFSQKNQFGRFMALSAILWLLYAASVRRHRLLACFAALSTVLVLFSRSATSIALLFLLLAVLVFARLVRSHSGAMLPVLAVALAGASYLATIVVRDPGRATGLLGRDASLTGRTQLWSLVWRAIQTHLWLGHGYGGFWLGFEGPSAAIWSVVDWNPPSAHDGFLDLMLDLGLVGMLIFVPVILVAFRYAFAMARRGRTFDTAFPLIFLAFYLLSDITESFLVAYNTISWVLFVAVTIQLHMWWHEEGRARPRMRARAAVASRLTPAVVPKQEIHTPLESLLPPTKCDSDCVRPSKERIALHKGSCMTAQVTVSAIMPTCNAMPHLKDAIDSVLAQTFTDWELIIVDDGSTDGTHDLLAQYDDPRIRVFELGEQGGIAKARNLALQFACGKYVAIAESDTISLPERFARQVSHLENNREIHVVASQIKYLHGDEQPRTRFLYPEEPAAIQRRFAKGQMAIPFPAAMIRAWCFDRFGPFRDDVDRGVDLEWFLRVRRNCNFRVLPDVLCLYRHDTDGVMFRQWIGDARYEEYALYRAERFGANIGGKVLSFDRFCRRWQTHLALYTRDALRYASYRMRSNIGGRRLT